MGQQKSQDADYKLPAPGPPLQLLHSKSCPSHKLSITSPTPPVLSRSAASLHSHLFGANLNASKSNLSISPHGSRLNLSLNAYSTEDESVMTLSPLTLKSASSKASSLKRRHHRRQSSVLIVNNGVTGQYISSRICKIGAKFWYKHVDTLSVDQQLEIGCSIFFAMLSSNDEMKQVMKAHFKENKKIEDTSVKFLDMIGWLIRYLITDDIDLPALLERLGRMHQAMGIKVQHFDPMLQSMHETFSYYYGDQYTIEVKYAFDEIFALAAQLMTNCKLNSSSHLMALSEQFQGNDIPFLKNLRVCLQSNIGKEYLFRYLQQTWCDELVLFLQSIARFKSMPSDKERFMIARDITKTCIEPSATFTLNISYECRANTLRMMGLFEHKFALKEPMEIPVTIFDEVEQEIYQLMLRNHWSRFVESIQDLQDKSFNQLNMHR